MQKKFRALLIFSKIYKDNDLYVKLLTNNDEILSGIVYGGLSNKKRNIYQVGFFLDINVTLKLNRPPVISADLTTPYISSIINDKYKLNCLLSTSSLLNLSIIEGQQVKNIYKMSENFINKMITQNRWITDYFCFLFDLLKIIGYQIDYDSNKKVSYFDLNSLDFIQNKTLSSILFPYQVLEEKYNNKININLVKNFFLIFERVYSKNHLSDLNLQLPNHYQLFKNQIMDYYKYK